jgi:hypothetical protein
MKFYLVFLDILFYMGLKFYVNQSLRMNHNIGKKVQSGFCYLLPFDLWNSYLNGSFPNDTRMVNNLFYEFSSSTRIFNRQQYSF